VGGQDVIAGSWGGGWAGAEGVVVTGVQDQPDTAAGEVVGGSAGEDAGELPGRREGCGVDAGLEGEDVVVEADEGPGAAVVEAGCGVAGAEWCAVAVGEDSGHPGGQGHEVTSLAGTLLLFIPATLLTLLLLRISSKVKVADFPASPARVSKDCSARLMGASHKPLETSGEVVPRRLSGPVDADPTGLLQDRYGLRDDVVIGLPEPVTDVPTERVEADPRVSAGPVEDRLLGRQGALAAA
jgi:hypothetical protein